VNVSTARQAAAAWVNAYASRQAGFRGAYLAGSIVGLPDEMPWPRSSDVDVMVVTGGEGEHAGAANAGDVNALPLGKFRYGGVLLEATLLPEEVLASPEAVLSSYHLAGAFRLDTILSDPTGRLRPLQRAVSASFAVRRWVRCRCREAYDKSDAGLAGIGPGAPFHAQLNAWAFSTGVMTHVLLVAALRNPTIRLRYQAVRAVLEAYGHETLYADLLGFLGCADWTRAQTEHHLNAVIAMFDAAAAIGTTRFPWSSDITSLARPILVEGSHALIDSGEHREAVFWIIATAARCQYILAADASDAEREAHAPAFQALAADLGIPDTPSLLARAAAARAYLPRVWEVAEEIIEHNTEIRE